MPSFITARGQSSAGRSERTVVLRGDAQGLVDLALDRQAMTIPCAVSHVVRTSPRTSEATLDVMPSRVRVSSDDVLEDVSSVIHVVRAARAG